MAKTVEISDELHHAIAKRAREEGLSIPEYLTQNLGLPVGTVTPPEVLDRIRNRPPVDLGISAADLIREGREERAQQLVESWLSSMRPR